MNNQEILRKIVNYIENVMKEKSLTSRDLADICVKKTGKMSPRTIDNMFKTPSSTTLSTLLKVCDGLDLNLNAVFHSIEIAKTSAENGQHRFIFDIEHPAYNGYTEMCIRDRFTSAAESFFTTSTVASSIQDTLKSTYFSSSTPSPNTRARS